MELTGESTITDILEQDLPRTKIFKDFHDELISKISESEKKVSEYTTTDKNGRKIKKRLKTISSTKDVIENTKLLDIENHFILWVSKINFFDDVYSGIEDSLLFIYGLLLPYYVDVSEFSINVTEPEKKQCEFFRPFYAIDESSFPHAIAVHHAHIAKQIILNGISNFSKTLGGQQTAKNKPEYIENYWKSKLFQETYHKFWLENHHLSQKDFHDKILTYLSKEYPNLEYKSDSSLNKWMPKLKKGEEISDTRTPHQKFASIYEITRYIHRQKNQPY